MGQADIVGVKAERCGCLGRETADTQVGTQHNNGKIYAIQQVGKVIVQLGKEFVAMLHFLVDRMQFLVGRLHFLFRSL